jgi:hypothetical protein
MEDVNKAWIGSSKNGQSAGHNAIVEVDIFLAPTTDGSVHTAYSLQVTAVEASESETVKPPVASVLTNLKDVIQMVTNVIRRC